MQVRPSSGGVETTSSAEEPKSSQNPAEKGVLSQSQTQEVPPSDPMDEGASSEPAAPREAAEQVRSLSEALVGVRLASYRVARGCGARGFQPHSFLTDGL
jgi:hypothetical protein